MARTEIPIVVLDTSGNLVSGASVQINIRASGSPATVYAAETGGTTVSNPLSTDAYGRVNGWVERGGYNAEISGTGLTTYTEPFESMPGSNGAIDSAALASGLVPQTGTSFPSSPADGQVYNYVADATNGIIWSFQYRQASLSTYKWEWIGGQPLRVRDNTTRSTTSTTAVDITNLNIATPLAGDYNCTLSGQVYNSTLGAAMYNKIYQASTTDTAQISVSASAANSVVPFYLATVLQSVPAGVSIHHRGSVSGGTGAWAERMLEIRPVRV